MEENRNIIQQVSELLGVELEEEFNIEELDGIFKFKEEGLLRSTDFKTWSDTNPKLLKRLIVGRSKIIKRDWRPKDGEEYYFYTDVEVGFCSDGDRYSKIAIQHRPWVTSISDLENFYCGNVFKSKINAEAHEEELMKRLKDRYYSM